MKPDDIIKTVTDSGLRGRGGAGFSRRAEVVVHPQGKEGPALPGGQRRRVGAGDVQGPLPDRLRPAPDARRHRHRGDRHAVRHRLHLHPRRISPPGEGARAGASRKRTTTSIFGQKGIFGSKYKLECYVHRGAGAYICGEETGLLEALEGKRGWPRNKPPFPAIAGAFAQADGHQQRRDALLRPAHHREGARRGSSRWARRSSPGPKLFGMSGHVNKPGVYEDELGITLAAVDRHWPAA